MSLFRTPEIFPDSNQLAPAARHQLLIEWNEPPDYPGGELLPELVAQQAAARPEACAIVCGERRVPYRELAVRAAGLAADLCSRGARSEVIAGVLLERSPDMVAAILALWQCGAAYLPLDPDLPAERLAWLLTDGLRGPGPRLVLTQRDLASRIPTAAGVELLLVEELGGLARAGVGSAWPPPLPESVAYLIYTSGSTGRPKGIVISHRSLANRILWARGTEFGPGDAYLQKTTPTFDISLSEIWTPLASGGRCVLARPGGQRDPAHLAELIARERITHASFPPPLLRLLLEVPGAAEKLRSLRVLITGGETVPPDLPRLAIQLLPATRVYNRYGPTETTISCMSGLCRPEGHGETVPIGRGTARTRVYVLDAALQLVLPGTAGELYLGGPGVGRGYLGQPDLTAERFVPDPFGEAGGRLYRTGDRARWRPEGVVDFLGRVDYQVKVRGHRIEIEEVELALMESPGVLEAAVVPLEEAATGSCRLVACVVSREGTPLDPGSLRRFLGDRLPGYMVPSAFVPLAEMPHTLSGKIDRAAIRKLAAGSRQAAAPAAAQGKGLAATLAGFCAELLEVSAIGPEDDLFALGAHSLLLVALQNRVRSELGIAVELADIVRHPTAGALARFIAAGAPAGAITPEQLAAEAELPADVRPTGRRDARSTGAAGGAVLLTGATGFLGAHLLAQLLVQTRARVFCLVRAADEEGADAALRRALERYGVRRHEEARRIVAVAGDLRRPRLGLDEGAFRELSATLGAVYHCGAQVNLLYPYEALRAANVAGTLEVLRLAAAGRPKTVHHVSTLAVLERESPAPADPVPEAPLDEPGAGLAGGYRQSKWVAERLVQAACGRGLPAVIYRPGWITGHSVTGIGSPSDFLVRLMVASLRLGAAPDLGDAEVCVTPVDYVSSVLVRLSRRRQPVGAVYHLVNPRRVAYDNLLEQLRELGYPLRKVPPRCWAKDLSELVAGSDDVFLAPLGDFLGWTREKLGAASLDGSAPPWRSLRFDTTKTQAALAAVGRVRCPDIDHRLLELYLKALVQQGLVSRPGASKGT